MFNAPQIPVRRPPTQAASGRSYKRFLILVLAAPLLSLPSCAQTWEKLDKKDAFTGNSYIQYSLTGKFLTPPRDGAVDAPRIVLECLPGEKKFSGKWYSAGQFIKGYIAVGAILNDTTNGVAVSYRRDDGKPQSAFWSISTDRNGLFPSGFQLNNILYGHDLIHKVNTTPPVKKLVLMADEYLGVGIVMQFDMTGIDDIAGGCGLAIYEKR